MKGCTLIARGAASVVLSLLVLFTPGPALAHCDTLDGPVIKAARQALATGNVNLVLSWVREADETEVKAAFQKVLEVRKLSPAARELADHYFFETLVRVHRQGEGAPYTGLKPAGQDLGAAIPAADQALETGLVEPMLKLLTDTVQQGLREQFRNVMSLKAFNHDDVAAGRQYVNAYVDYIHYVERLYAAATEPAHGHYPEPKALSAQRH